MRRVRRLESLQRNPSLVEPSLQHVKSVLQLDILSGGYHQLIVNQLDLRLAALEVEARMNLLDGLLDGVPDLLHIHFGDYVE